MLFVIARSTSMGIKAGIISSLGIMTGGLVHTIMAVVGLSAIIAQSATAFLIIKLLGGGYLIYLGIKAILTKSKIMRSEIKHKIVTKRKLFLQGAITNILNPKVALFFLAFLPQFINIHNGNISLSILFLGAWFNIGGTLINILVAILFGKAGAIISKSPRFIQWQGKLTGIILIGLGIKVAISSKK
jgi:threonine/homoserine/homoserine lactone efflux protein